MNIIYFIKLFFLISGLIIAINNINTIPGKEILSGTVMNAIPFIANDFKMPTMWYQNEPFYTQMSNKTSFNFLGDYILIDSPFIGKNHQISTIILSPGDILIATGIITYLYNIISTMYNK